MGGRERERERERERDSKLGESRVYRVHADHYMYDIILYTYTV